MDLTGDMFSSNQYSIERGYYDQSLLKCKIKNHVRSQRTQTRSMKRVDSNGLPVIKGVTKLFRKISRKL